MSLTSLSSTTFLSNLFNTGADAQSNLFTVDIIPSPELEGEDQQLSHDFLDSLRIRTNKFSTPKIGVFTKKVTYQNSEIEVSLPSSDLDRRISFDFRLDQNYDAYKILVKYLPISSEGIYSDNLDMERRYFTIKATAYNTSSTGYDPSCIWKFNKCILTSLDSFDFSYNSSEIITIRASFIFDYFSFEEAS